MLPFDRSWKEGERDEGSGYSVASVVVGAPSGGRSSRAGVGSVHRLRLLHDQRSVVSLRDAVGLLAGMVILSIFVYVVASAVIR